MCPGRLPAAPSGGRHIRPQPAPLRCGGIEVRTAISPPVSAPSSANTKSPVPYSPDNYLVDDPAVDRSLPQRMTHHMGNGVHDTDGRSLPAIAASIFRSFCFSPITALWATSFWSAWAMRAARSDSSAAISGSPDRASAPGMPLPLGLHLVQTGSCSVHYSLRHIPLRAGCPQNRGKGISRYGGNPRRRSLSQKAQERGAGGGAEPHNYSNAYKRGTALAAGSALPVSWTN